MKRLILLTVAILAFCGIFAQAVNPTIWQGNQGQSAPNQTPWYNSGGCGWSCAYIDSLIIAHGGGGGSGWSLTGNAGTNSGHNYLGTVDNASLNIITNNTTRLFIDSINNSVFGSASQLYIGSTGSSFNTNFIADGAYFDQYNTNCSGYNNSLFDGSYGPYYCNGVNFYNNITASGSYEGYYSVGGTYSYNCAFGESYPDYEDSTTDFYANAFFGDAYTYGLVNCDFYENICNGEDGSAYDEHSSTMDYNFSNYGTISAYGLENSIYYGLIQGYESYGAFHDTSCYLQNYFIANGGIGTENQKGVSSSNFTVIGTGAVGNCSNCFVVDLGDGQQYGTNGEFSIFGSGSPAFKLVDGTQSSGYVLTSDASGNASWQANTGGGWGLNGNNGTNSGNYYLGTGDNAAMGIATNDTFRIYIDSTDPAGITSGFVGIGTSTPYGILDVESSGLSFALNNGGLNSVYSLSGLTTYFQVSNTNVYCNGGDGALFSINTQPGQYGVGIGTNTPTVLLDVEGSSPAFKLADGTEAASEVLTSDANGNASWINTLNFTSGSTSVDYQNGTLWDGSHGFPVMQWKSSLLTDLGGNTSVDWQNRIAYDNSGVEDMSWGNGVGIDTATIRSAAIGNTTSPSSILTILNNHSNISVDTVSYGSLNGGLIEMTYPAGGGGNDNAILNIVSTGSATGNWGSAIAFYTRPNGTTNLMKDVVRITNVGNVYLTQPAAGFILTDANGACWLYTASITTGALVPSSVACPSH